ncbi:hypothetical protein ACTXT7_013229, partial [Hymenolepis weldensis]
MLKRSAVSQNCLGLLCFISYRLPPNGYCTDSLVRSSISPHSPRQRVFAISYSVFGKAQNVLDTQILKTRLRGFVQQSFSFSNLLDCSTFSELDYQSSHSPRIAGGKNCSHGESLGSYMKALKNGILYLSYGHRACARMNSLTISHQKTEMEGYRVLDSKQGPGPKHMKEIAKRARRREAKRQQQQQITQQLEKHLINHNHQSFPSRVTSSNNSHNRITSLSKNNHSLSSSTNNNSTPSGPSSSSRALHSSHQHHSHYGHHLATCVACWAHQNNDTKVSSVNSASSANGNGLVNNSAATSTPMANAGGGAFHPPTSNVNVRTRSSVSRKLDLASMLVEEEKDIIPIVLVNFALKFGLLIIDHKERNLWNVDLSYSATGLQDPVSC